MKRKEEPSMTRRKGIQREERESKRAMERIPMQSIGKKPARPRPIRSKELSSIQTL
jgi:hypothetical protein